MHQSMTRVDLPVPLMHNDPNDFGSLILIQITPKERTLSMYIIRIFILPFLFFPLSLAVMGISLSAGPQLAFVNVGAKEPGEMISG